MMRCAEEDGLLPQRRSPLAVLQHALHDVAGLVSFVPHADKLRSGGGVSVRPEVLGEALSRQIDYAVCSREDWLSRAIIALQRNDLCRRAELCGEVEDVADSRGAERINRLGVIADDGQPKSARLERENDRSLEPVGVLIFIDKDLVEAATVIIAKAWLADHLSPVEQKVIVIEHFLTLLGLDISGKQLLQLGHPGGAPRERRAQDFFDREFGIDATRIDRKARPLCRRSEERRVGRGGR